MKTIELVANDYAHRNWGDCFDASFEQLENAFKAGVEFAKRWISVEDELPELNKKVIIKYNVSPTKELAGCTDFDIDKLILNDKNTWMFDIEQQCGISVTHWLPIYLVK